MNRKSSRGCLFALFMILIIGGGILLLLSTKIPDVSQQVADTSTNLIVTLTKPLNNSQWPPYTALPINADSAGDQTTLHESLELWVDGSLVESKDTSDGSASWTWTITQGEHTLLVRARDSQGHVANSNIVHVIGTDSASPGMVVLYTAQAGDTLTGIAAQFNVDIQQINALNPQLGNDLPIGSIVKVPVQTPQPPSAPAQPTPPSAPDLPSQPPSFGIPNKYAFWFGQFLNPSLPNAPQLTVTVNGCTASLFITDTANNESGFNIYRVDSQSQIFKSIATLGANNNSALPIQYDDPNIFGAFNYYVSAFNASGDAPSNVVGVNVSDANCKSPFWNGQALDVFTPSSVPIPIINVPPPTYDQAYFYYSLDESSWSRVPGDPNAFLALPEGIFDVDEQIKNANLQVGEGNPTLHIDAWGWVGGTLTHIGTFIRNATNPNEPPSVYNSTKLEICSIESCKGDTFEYVSTGASSTEYLQWPLRWTAGSDSQTNALVQVSVIPFSNTCDVKAAGLVWTTNLKKYGSGGSNNFWIDFTTLKGKSAVVDGSDLTSDKFYIRILPMQGNQVICEPSNTVWWSKVEPSGPPQTIKVPPKAPVPPNAYTLKIMGFTPVQFPDTNYKYCVLITANPYYGQPSLPAGPWAQMAVGTTVCPENYAGKGGGSIWDSAGDLIGGLVNITAELYNGLKGFAVKLAANLNPLCIQAKIGAEAINSGKETVESVCNKVAEVAVNAGMAYVGLPPSLPNYDQLVGVSKGYVADLAVEELGDSYCLDKAACKKVVESGLDQVITQIKQSRNNSACLDQDTAHAYGFEPLCAPAGVLTTPSPLGQLTPAIVTVQFTRNADIPDSAFPDPVQFPTSCDFHVTVKGQNDSYIGQQIVVGSNKQTGLIYWTGTSLNDELFKSVGGSMPKLALGESITIPFALKPNSTDFPPTAYNEGFWLPGHLKSSYAWQASSGFKIHDHDDWRYLYFGSTTTVALDGGCTTKGNGFSPSRTSTTETITVTIPNVQH